MSSNLQAVDFNRDVRPILSNSCFHCHGPDDQTREADLRLDVADGFIGTGDDFAINLSDLSASEFLRRINSKDPNEVMPPPDSGKLLNERQRNILMEWVSEGATWELHWAFSAPKQPFVPKDDSDWSQNPIDNFIINKAKQAGLSVSQQADADTLIRRLYLDLTGKIPSSNEMEHWSEKFKDIEIHAAEEDEAWDTVYGELVDTLLNSPAYGEHWARSWLDLARYADTNGYEKDRERPIWPYRDWVISALNADMPFDQFTVEQLAGDMLPQATTEQIVATGFHRNTMLNEEGGIDPLEFRFHALNDRVATTGTTWLGLTLECSQCHNHKFDPISQREYYSLMAFLDNADEIRLPLVSEEDKRVADSQSIRIESLVAGAIDTWKTKNVDRSFDVDFAEWLTAAREKQTLWNTLEPRSMGTNSVRLRNAGDGVILGSGDPTKKDEYHLEFNAEAGPITAIRLEVLPDVSLPNYGPGLAYYEGPLGDFFLSEFTVTVSDETVVISKATDSYCEGAGSDGAKSAAGATDGDVQTGWSVQGRLGESHEAVFNLDNPIPTGSSFSISMTFSRHYPAPLGKFRLSATNEQGAVAANGLDEANELLLRKDREKLSESELRQLQQCFALQHSSMTEIATEIRSLRKTRTGNETLAFRERDEQTSRKTFIHHRGEYLSPTEEVSPSVPKALHEMQRDVKLDRLSLARWLTAKENPLTARVTVNRQWANIFGTGLVKTIDDFGSQGDAPSHPELLDWLALYFQEEAAWSLKRLHKLMVSSATYRQSSKVNTASLATDPSNRLLTYSPRYRLTGEVIRDSILVASQKLNPQLGGPPVYPPQPAGVTEVSYQRQTWPVSSGADRYRRSIYTFAKRTAPFAMLSVFDGPSGEECVARRDRSNSPLQALTLLNDEMFIELALGLGTHISNSNMNEVEKARRIFVTAMCRVPSDRELAHITEYYETIVSSYIADEAALNQFCTLDANLTTLPVDQKASVAGWANVARALFALDEFMTRN